MAAASLAKIADASVEDWILTVQSTWSESLELQYRELGTWAKDHGLHSEFTGREREIHICGSSQKLESARDSLRVLWREIFGEDEALLTQLKKIETLPERRVIGQGEEEWILAVLSKWSTSLELQLSRELGTLAEEYGLQFWISGSMREICLCGTSENLQNARESLRVLWREMFGDDEALPMQLEKIKTHLDEIVIGLGDTSVELTTLTGISCRLVGLDVHHAVEAILVAAATWLGIPADEVQLVIDAQDILQWSHRNRSAIDSGIFDGSCILCVRSR